MSRFLKHYSMERSHMWDNDGKKSLVMSRATHENCDLITQATNKHISFTFKSEARNRFFSGRYVAGVHAGSLSCGLYALEQFSISYLSKRMAHM